MGRKTSPVWPLPDFCICRVPRKPVEIVFEYEDDHGRPVRETAEQCTKCGGLSRDWRVEPSVES